MREGKPIHVLARQSGAMPRSKPRPPAFARGCDGHGAQGARIRGTHSGEGAATAVMVDSGSNALFLAVKALGLPPGSEVIVPSFTWVAWCARGGLGRPPARFFADGISPPRTSPPKLGGPSAHAHDAAVMIVPLRRKARGRGCHAARLTCRSSQDAAHAVDSGACANARVAVSARWASTVSTR